MFMSVTVLSVCSAFCSSSCQVQILLLPPGYSKRVFIQAWTV